MGLKMGSVKMGLKMGSVNKNGVRVKIQYCIFTLTPIILTPIILNGLIELFS
jgi:hypothetical protein